MVQHGGIERGRPRQETDAILLDPSQHGFGVEGPLRQDGRATNEGREPTRLEAEAVEERVDDQVAVAWLQADDLAPVVEQAQVLAMGTEHALGVAGGAGGEHQVREAVAVEAGHPLGQHLVGHLPGQVDEALPGAIAAAGRFEDDGLLEVIERLSRQQVRVVTAEELANAEQHARPTASEDIRRLAALQARAQRHQHRPGHQAAEGGQQPVMAVRRPDGDALARFESNGQQRPPCMAAEALQFRIAELELAIIDGDLLCMTSGRKRQSGRDGLRVGERQTHGRHSCGRAMSPRAG
ncbi:hypothetical protein FQZ97_838770 [compost metagenome]